MQRKFLINFPTAGPGREAPGRSGTARAPCSGPPSAWAPRWPPPPPWMWSWRRWKCWRSCAGSLPCAGCWAPRCPPSCRLYLQYDSQISSAWQLQGNLYEPEEAVSAVPLHFSAGWLHSVTGHLVSSGPQLFSPKTAPRLSVSAGTWKQQPCFSPRTFSFSHQGLHWQLFFADRLYLVSVA